MLVIPGPGAYNTCSNKRRMTLGEMDEFDRMSESLRKIQCGWPGRQSRGRGIPDAEMRREMR